MNRISAMATSSGLLRTDRFVITMTSTGLLSSVKQLALKTLG